MKVNMALIKIWPFVSLVVPFNSCQDELTRVTTVKITVNSKKELINFFNKTIPPSKYSYIIYSISRFIQ